MGIESDQVVYEYLSRVGDVAQQRQLSSATRMRLVSELRNEIDRCRARAAVDSPAAVRRILDRLGSPDDIVTAAGGTGASTGTGTGMGTGGGYGGYGSTQAPGPAGPAVPVQRDTAAARPAGTGAQGDAADGAERARPKGLRRVVPRPRPAPPPASPAPPPAGARPPHLATAEELGAGAAGHPHWWRAAGPAGGPGRVDESPFGIGDDVPGFVGGVEIPELLKAPPPGEPAKEAEPVPAVVEDAAEAAVETAPRRRLALLPRGLARGSWSNPLLLLAAALLVVGAVLGNWFVLLFGWVIAYGSRRLTRTETQWAVMGMPALALAAGAVWLWGRQDGRWGDPVAQGHMNDAITQTWPWVVRAAAVLSALFLAWRSQRQR
ncbi:hypothetical protein ABZ858_04910 [Streptomyces sp. NPDC047017]|uniref:hypothetical protein n=1 Tax=Streptomyces sp. NPDC047017 TaxID=3155024 RepID=UPI0033F564EB